MSGLARHGALRCMARWGMGASRAHPPRLAAAPSRLQLPGDPERNVHTCTPLCTLAHSRAPPAPPQIQSNALGALEALDARVAQRVYEEGCITGDRINGLCDGVTGDWCAAGRPGPPLPALKLKAPLPPPRNLCVVLPAAGTSSLAPVSPL